MTYCVGLWLKDGLVLLSDTRTNAGVDNISTFGKMHVVETPGDRVIIALTAGNLAITQAVINRIIELQPGINESARLLANVGSMIEAVELVGQAVRDVYRMDGPALQAQHVDFDVSILLAGQIKGQRMRLFQVYSAGNYIEASIETPFLQIGEYKYGRPIFVRILSYETDLYDGVQLSLLSMDATLHSNLTVGMPIDLAVYRNNSLKLELQRRITDQDPYFRHLQGAWAETVRRAIRSLPRPEF